MLASITVQDAPLTSLILIFSKDSFSLEDAHFSPGNEEREGIFANLSALGAQWSRKEPPTLEGNLESLLGLRSAFVNVLGWY